MSLTKTVVLALVAMTAMPAVSNGLVSPGGNFTRLMELDCDGNAYVLPSHPDFQMAVGGEGWFNKIFETLRTHIISIAECHCPNLASSGKADLYFGIGVQMVLNLFQKSTAWSPSELDAICNGKSYFDTVGDEAFLPVHLSRELSDSDAWKPAPSTCTAEQYATNGCFFKLPIPANAGITVQLAVKQCPSNGNNKLPFIGISASGMVPEGLFKPCSQNSDCGNPSDNALGMTCDLPTELVTDDDAEPIGELLTNLLEELGVYSSTCTLSVTGMGAQMNKIMMSYVGKMMGVAQDTSNLSRMCGLKKIRSVFESDIVLRVEQPKGQNEQCDSNDECAAGLMCLRCSAWNGTADQFYCGQYVYENRCQPCSQCKLTQYGYNERCVDGDCNNCECPNNEFLIIPDNFTSWDGILPDGMNVRSLIDSQHPISQSIQMSSRVTQECQASYNAGNVVPVMQHQCRLVDRDPTMGAYLLTPLSPIKFAAQFPLIQSMIKSFVLPAFTSVIDSCHAGNMNLMQDFQPWHVGFWIRIMTAGRKPTEGPPTYAYTLWEKFHELIDWDDTVAFPSTCSEARWNSEQVCQFQYAHANKMFGFPDGTMTLRFTLSKCNNNPEALPFLYVDCVGSNCKRVLEFYRLQTCSSDNECPSGKCSSFNNYKIDFEEGKPQYNGAGLLQYVLWHGNNTDQCGTGKDDLLTLIDIYRSLSGEAQLTNNEKASATSWCETIFEDDSIESSLESWTDDLYSESTNMFGTTQYNIHGLENWQEVSGGNDGCKFGVDGGAHAAHSNGVAPTLPIQTAPPTKAGATPSPTPAPKSSVTVSMTTGASNTLSSMSEQDKQNLQAAYLSGLQTISAGTTLSGYMFSLSADDVILSQTDNGISFTVNVPTSEEGSSTLLTEIDTHQNTLTTSVNNAGALPQGQTASFGSASTGGVKDTDSSSSNNDTTVIVGAVCGTIVFIVLIVAVTVVVIKMKGASASPAYKGNLKKEGSSFKNPNYDEENPQPSQYENETPQ